MYCYFQQLSASYTHFLSCGVPQGSILGPLLFFTVHAPISDIPDIYTLISSRIEYCNLIMSSTIQSLQFFSLKQNIWHIILIISSLHWLNRTTNCLWISTSLSGRTPYKTLHFPMNIQITRCSLTLQSIIYLLYRG